MGKYEIQNRVSGARLGVYEGSTPEEAIEAMHRDAGCGSSAGAAAALEQTVEQLRAELIVTAVEG